VKIIRGKIKRFTIPAEIKYLTKIRDFADKHGEKFGFNLRQINGLKLSLDEICTNIIRYAYKGMDKNGKIKIEIVRKGDKVSTTIIDNGVKFDYNSVLNPDLNKYVEEKRKGGFGIYLVKQLNNEVVYKRINNQNILTLYNNIEPKPSIIELIKKNFKPSKMAIRVRFAIISTLLISLISAGTYFFALHYQKRTLTKQYINNYILLLRNFASNNADYILDERNLLVEEQIYKLIEEDSSIVRLTVIDRNGVIFADKYVPNIRKLYKSPAGIIPLIEQEYLVKEYEDSEFGSCIYLSIPIRMADSFVGKVFLAIKKESLDSMVVFKLNKLKMAIYMFIFWIFGIVGISFMGNIFITPIRRITEELNRVSKEGLGGGFHFAGAGEFAEISTAFNRMMKEIKRSEVKLTDQARLKREMQLAQSIQQSLLPKNVPETEGFEISAKYSAAMEVGGDYYDFFYVDDNALGIAVGDVSGKGMGGAFLMSIVRTALRLEARGQRNASEVLKHLNATLDGEFKKGMYITIFFIILSSKKREINYASAGHTPMILYRAETDQIYKLNPKGFPIGLNLGDGKYFRKSVRNEKISLNKGDLLLVYTDGITEAMNQSREEFSDYRLLEVIRNYNYLSTNDFGEKLLEELKNFTQGYPQSDDITFVVIKNKEKYSELLYQKRKKLFDLIEKQGFAVKDACKKIGISQSSYYKLKKLKEEKGLQALIPKSRNLDINVLDFDISQKILEIIKGNPELSAKKIKEALNTERYGSIDVETTLIYRELRRLNLYNKGKRISYVKRIKRR